VFREGTVIPWGFPPSSFGDCKKRLRRFFWVFGRPVKGGHFFWGIGRGPSAPQKGHPYLFRSKFLDPIVWIQSVESKSLNPIRWIQTFGFTLYCKVLSSNPSNVIYILQCIATRPTWAAPLPRGPLRWHGANRWPLPRASYHGASLPTAGRSACHVRTWAAPLRLQLWPLRLQR